VGQVQIKQFVCWKARRLADWPFIHAFQMTVAEIIIASALLSNAQHVGLLFGLYCQGRINQYSNYAMAWGPPVQGAPLGGTNFLIFKFQ